MAIVRFQKLNKMPRKGENNNKLRIIFWSRTRNVSWLDRIKFRYEQEEPVICYFKATAFDHVQLRSRLSSRGVKMQ